MNRTIKAALLKVPGAARIYSFISKYTVLPARVYMFRVRGGAKFRHLLAHPGLAKALEGRQAPEIADLLGTIFFFALQAKPKLMVELGTRGGESTRALLTVSSITGAQLLSLDINDCGDVDVPHKQFWTFIKRDDVQFGKEEFANWCAEKGLQSKADVIFLDTSHKYEHTVKELETWIPYLAQEGVLMLHDTNMGPGMFARTDGSITLGWDNSRGVIAAIEKLLGRKYDESAFFYDYTNGFAIIHFPYSSGMTVLKKCALPEESPSQVKESRCA